MTLITLLETRSFPINTDTAAKIYRCYIYSNLESYALRDASDELHKTGENSSASWNKIDSDRRRGLHSVSAATQLCPEFPLELAVCIVNLELSAINNLN